MIDPNSQKGDEITYKDLSKSVCPAKCHLDYTSGNPEGDFLPSAYEPLLEQSLTHTCDMCLCPKMI